MIEVLDGLSIEELMEEFLEYMNSGGVEFLDSYVIATRINEARDA